MLKLLLGVWTFNLPFDPTDMDDTGVQCYDIVLPQQVQVCQAGFALKAWREVLQAGLLKLLSRPVGLHIPGQTFGTC